MFCGIGQAQPNVVAVTHNGDSNGLLTPRPLWGLWLYNILCITSYIYGAHGYLMKHTKIQMA